MAKSLTTAEDKFSEETRRVAALDGDNHHRKLQDENSTLRLRVAQLEEALRAIHANEVDGLFLPGPEGDRLYTLEGADRAYRQVIEEMSEGAITLSSEGIVLYANKAFSRLMNRPLSHLVSGRIQGCFAPEDYEALRDMLIGAPQGRRSSELDLICAERPRVGVLVSVGPLQLPGAPGALCMIITDLTERKRTQAEIDAREVLKKLLMRQQITQRDLEQSLQTLQLRDNALASITQGVLITDSQRLTTYVNPAFEAITGYAAAEMIGKHCSVLQGPDTDPQTIANMRQALNDKQPCNVELLNYRKDGTPFWNDLSITPVFNASGMLTQYVGIQRDVTQRRETQANLALAAQMFEQGNEAFVITDAQRNIVKVNRAFTVITGFEESAAIGQPYAFLNVDQIDEAAYTSKWLDVERLGHWQGEVLKRYKDGTSNPQWLSIGRLVDASGRTSNYIASFIDITQRKKAEENIRFLAEHDALTGLPNRVLLAERATYSIQLAQRRNEPLALMFIDLDHFKNVNDSLGHSFGDLLLVALADRLKSELREQDTLARVGGDEFVLILPGSDAASASRVAHKMIALLETHFEIGMHELSISPSIGIALYPADGSNFDELARSADAAMYKAKNDGRNTFRFFTPEIQAHAARLFTLENALRYAIERNQLSLHYQPQMSAIEEQIVGAEALLRWSHPELGSVSPAEFIPVAESSGLISSIGEWVLRTAVHQLKCWLDAGMKLPSLSVNLSAVQFRQEALPELVSQVLRESGLPPHYLDLELTESVAADDPMGAVEIIQRLHETGVRMSIDDFGTGYSSLSYLKRFKVDKLKIDQSFVRNVLDDPDDQAIISTIISLAANMGLQTIAEGVETVAQKNYLCKLGCMEIQGYWLSRPLPVEKFEAFMRDRSVG